jgi:amidase
VIGDEFQWIDGVAQGELVAKREVTPLELVEAAIARIERVNPTFNLVVTPMYEMALQEARKCEVEGRLAGVPFLLKDLIATCEGVRQTEGSRFLGDYVAQRDSEYVRRLKHAGLILVGKTNTPEFGNASTTEPLLFGPSRNPWDLGRTTGGSSGGSAGAVCAGLVAAAHGNDTGGSIRTPASCCGVFGLKPTRARNPLGPDYGDAFCGFLAEHVLTRSVRDSAALLDATSGPSEGDPYAAPAVGRSFLEEINSAPTRLRIAYATRTLGGAEVHPECAAVVLQTAALCVDLGHEVEEATPSVDPEWLEHAFFTTWSEGIAWTIDSWAKRLGRPPTSDQFEPLTWAVQKIGRERSAAEHLLMLQELQAVSRDIARFFSLHDVWLTPTLAEPPVPLGTFDAPTDDPLRSLRRDAEFSPFVWMANVTGQPAMSVPLFWSNEGLPIGSHFVGRFGEERALFRLAAQLEEAQPWAHRHPPGVQRDDEWLS